MAKIIAVANQKGGVGKTTTAINFSSCLAMAEKKTLLIDIDPQANSTSGVGFDKATMDISIYDVLIGRKEMLDVILPTELSYLNVAPSSIALVGAEVEMVGMFSRELILSKAITSIADQYDYIIIDCPPSLGLLTINALTAANGVMIPVQCEYYALEGLSQLLETIKLVQKNLNPELDIEGVLLTMYDSRLNLSRQVAEEARKFFDNRVYNTVINRNVRLSEAPSFGKPIIMYDILSTGAENYMALTREVLNR
ncbi:MAG: ParA family protein [candidate division Zixibacteria bacterium]|nr:ParA family protein [candidate division Zixibacteria bacterium]